MTIGFGCIAGFLLWVQVRKLLTTKVGLIPTIVFAGCITASIIASIMLDTNFQPLWRTFHGPG